MTEGIDTPMTEPTTTEPADVATKAEPHAAVIELLHRHGDSEKYPYTGGQSVILPNFLRIDGVGIWAPEDRPVVIEEIELDGRCLRPFAVTVTLQARALRVGAAPMSDGPIGGPDSNSGAVLEIPDVDEFFSGEELEPRYVLLNGNRLYIQGPVKIGKLNTGGPDWSTAEVTVTLLCRKLIVDDEPIGAAAP